MTLEEYLAHDGLGLAELVRGGEVTCAELVELAIAQADRVNPELNAVVYPMYEEAWRIAKEELPSGPFGVEKPESSLPTSATRGACLPVVGFTRAAPVVSSADA